MQQVTRVNYQNESHNAVRSKTFTLFPWFIRNITLENGIRLCWPSPVQFVRQGAIEAGDDEFQDTLLNLMLMATPLEQSCIQSG
jgi:hypothetical protein